MRDSRSRPSRSVPSRYARPSVSRAEQVDLALPHVPQPIAVAAHEQGQRVPPLGVDRVGPGQGLHVDRFHHAVHERPLQPSVGEQAHAHGRRGRVVHVPEARIIRRAELGEGGHEVADDDGDGAGDRQPAVAELAPHQPPLRDAGARRGQRLVRRCVHYGLSHPDRLAMRGAPQNRRLRRFWPIPPNHQESVDLPLTLQFDRLLVVPDARVSTTASRMARSRTAGCRPPCTPRSA